VGGEIPHFSRSEKRGESQFPTRDHFVNQEGASNIIIGTPHLMIEREKKRRLAVKSLEKS